jgi:hypothetical protein
MMDHTLHTPLDAVEINEANLLGAVIYGPYDQRIGTVAQLLVMGPVTKVIVDVGGFLGIGTRPVSLDANQLNFMRDESGAVHAVTTWTKDEVMALPEHRH